MRSLLSSGSAASESGVPASACLVQGLLTLTPTLLGPLLLRLFLLLLATLMSMSVFSHPLCSLAMLLVLCTLWVMEAVAGLRVVAVAVVAVVVADCCQECLVAKVL